VPFPDSRAPAPLSTWYIAMAVAAMAWAIAWFAVVRGGAQMETTFTRFNRARVESFEARAAATGARRIVLLGSSALKYATRDEGEFAAGVGKVARVPVAALRISSNWGTFYDFVPLAADILRARPDVVVMESEFLAADRPPLRRFLLWVEDLRRQLGLDDAQDAPADDESRVQFGYPCWERGLSPNNDRLLELRSDWISIRPAGPGPRSTRRFAEELLAAGVEVVFVAIPRRPDYEVEARRTRAIAGESEAGRALSGRVQHWEPAPVPGEMYCDLTHVKPTGQARISDWLESSIARTLSRPAP
jgi:hypothetical protein